MSETLIMALIGLAGGAGGLFTLVKAWLDHKSNAASRIDEADERLVARLERRLDEAEKRITELEAQHDRDNAYILILITKIAGSGETVPPRP